jgi:PilZ domain
VSSSIVLIGPSEALPGLKERLAPGAQFRAFTEVEALEALDHIIGTKPAIVALEVEFSSSTRGMALINRIKADPSLTGCEVRVISHGSEVHRVAVGRASGGVAVVEPKAVLDQKGTRRAQRFRMREGVEVTVDGNAARLVDLSVVGAQVISNSVLKPNQRVRVIMGEGKTAVRCSGSLVWASFEMPKGLPPRYRGGVDFVSPDGNAINAFAKKHKVSN